MNVKNEVLEFLDLHSACSDGRNFALSHETLADVYDKHEAEAERR